MALITKINSTAKTTANSGFGANASSIGGRALNKEGNPNLYKTGIGFFEKISWFHTLLAMPVWHFFFIILLFYVIVNLLFASIYFLIGVEHLSGLNATSTGKEFWEAFFFSTQTFTTVGYGRISPVGFTASVISSFEALMGLLSFALVTGLIYARFSKPNAFLRFSNNAVIAPYKGFSAFMLRVALFKNTQLVDGEAKLTLAMPMEENGKMIVRFFPLQLELEKINALTLSWTIVHPITKESPFYNFTEEDYKTHTGEILVYIKAFDDMFSNTVVARSSYTFNEIVYGAKYLPMFFRDEIKQATFIDLSKLNEFEAAKIS